MWKTKERKQKKIISKREVKMSLCRLLFFKCIISAKQDIKHKPQRLKPKLDKTQTQTSKL
jgi:hypothetical protein